VQSIAQIIRQIVGIYKSFSEYFSRIPPAQTVISAETGGQSLPFCVKSVKLPGKALTNPGKYHMMPMFTIDI
jgi:hypothetical protein